MRCTPVLLLFFALLAGCSSADPGGGLEQGVDAASGLETDSASDTASDVALGDDSCLGLPDGAACDDGDLCTLGDKCEQGLCVGGVSEPCDAEGPCRLGICDPGTGCSYVDAAAGTACSVACFTSATCNAGACQADANSAVECPVSNEPCVHEIGCDAATGDCTHMIMEPAGFECDSDGNVCTAELCDGQGACEATGEVETCEDENVNNPCWTWTCTPKTGCIQALFVEGNYRHRPLCQGFSFQGSYTIMHTGS